MKAGSWPCAPAPGTAPGSRNIHDAVSFAYQGPHRPVLPALGVCVLAPLPGSYLSPLPPRHEAQRLEQEARGRLERQKILDQSEAEKARRELLELEALRWVENWEERWQRVLEEQLMGGVCVFVCA